MGTCDGRQRSRGRGWASVSVMPVGAVAAAATATATATVIVAVCLGIVSCFGTDVAARRGGVAYRPAAEGVQGVDYNTLSAVGKNEISYGGDGGGGDNGAIDVGELVRRREAADRFVAVEDIGVTSAAGVAVIDKVPSITLLDRLRETPNENILRQSARVARLDAFLDDPSRELTLFAPTDRAFEFLPRGALEYIEAKPRELKYVVQSHIANGVIDVSDLRDGMTLSGVDGTSHEIDFVRADTDGGGAGYWTIDGIRIIEGDIFAENGVMHRIDGILGSAKVVLPRAEDLQTALDICRETRGLRGFKLANCVRLVAQGLDSDDVPTRPDMEDLP